MAGNLTSREQSEERFQNREGRLSKRRLIVDWTNLSRKSFNPADPISLQVWGISPGRRRGEDGRGDAEREEGASGRVGEEGGAGVRVSRRGARSVFF